MAKRIKWKLPGHRSDDVTLVPTIRDSNVSNCVILHVESGNEFCVPLRLYPNGTLELPSLDENVAERMGIQLDSRNRIRIKE